MEIEELILHTCPVCETKKREFTVPCLGAETKDISPPIILVCLCTKNQEFYCNCGNPCNG
jgi:hypothetical protein